MNMMIPIRRFENPADLAVAESMLIANGIPCFVHNRHFGGLYPGVQIELYNVCTLMVPRAAASEASEILNLLDAAPDTTTDAAEIPEAAASPRPGFSQIMRMVIECFMFGWFIPAKPKRPKLDDD